MGEGDVDRQYRLLVEVDSTLAMRMCVLFFRTSSHFQLSHHILMTMIDRRDGVTLDFIADLVSTDASSSLHHRSTEYAV